MEQSRWTFIIKARNVYLFTGLKLLSSDYNVPNLKRNMACFVIVVSFDLLTTYTRICVVTFYHHTLSLYLYWDIYSVASTLWDRDRVYIAATSSNFICRKREKCATDRKFHTISLCSFGCRERRRNKNTFFRLIFFLFGVFVVVVGWCQRNIFHCESCDVAKFSLFKCIEYFALFLHFILPCSYIAFCTHTHMGALFTINFSFILFSEPIMHVSVVLAMAEIKLTTALWQKTVLKCPLMR